ncbi:SDR family oxidoreductase [Desulfatibacillum aliphaticivorans]|uniref:SDR family oxidoreductase n=1 Tax=Desulfatibacillum aliphaticivorans TaxID=218208 RepID=UPI00041238F2|nr:SDR family oxidoreductase [Desulfatibacillum aliphaticivorans]
MKFDSGYWAIIIGASSGFGLATAKKLASHGMNLCLVHRDRRGAVKNIQPSFDEIAATGVQMLTFNLDALSPEGRAKALDGLAENLGESGSVRLLMHSLAFGNLKLLAPYEASGEPARARAKMADLLGVMPQAVDEAAAGLFAQGCPPIHSLADEAEFNNRFLLEEDDFSRTIHAMGTSLVEWVQDVFNRKMFAADARVLSLTSEGNAVAWRGYAAVSAAKAALESVSRAIAVEFAPYGIRCNVVQPGVTDTPAFRAIPGNPQIEAKALLRNPMGRLTTPQDVANLIFLLCLDEAAWINGSLIPVDGGERIA